MDEDLRDLLKEASATLASTSRLLASPKVKIEDLDILGETLKLTAETIRTLRDMQHMRNSKIYETSRDRLSSNETSTT